MFSIEAIMSTDLITVPPTATLAEARTLMHNNRIHHLPVVKDDGELIGLVTLTNVLAATDSVLRDADNRIHAAEILVRDIMVTEIATIDERASLRQAALFIQQIEMIVMAPRKAHRFRRRLLPALPVWSKPRTPIGRRRKS